MFLDAAILRRLRIQKYDCALRRLSYKMLGSRDNLTLEFWPTIEIVNLSKIW